MPIADSKKDRLMPVIFSQLEFLQDLSLRAEEPELANDLSVVFAKALERYCDAKRKTLAAAIENGADEIQRKRRSSAGGQKVITIRAKPVAPALHAHG